MDKAKLVESPPEDGEERRLLSGQIPKDVFVEFKSCAVSQDVKMQDAITYAAQLYIAAVMDKKKEESEIKTHA